LSKDGLKTIKSKVDAVAKWTCPKDISELRSFLGTVRYYRKFIDKFSTIAAPLCKLLRQDVPYEWDNEQQESFDGLKMALVNVPILRYPDSSKQFIIRTDASRNGIGGVLLQVKEGDLEHQIHFVSRTLTAAERNYSITDLEGTAVYF